MTFKILISLISLVSSRFIEYHFYENFGQVFHDYSGNFNHAVNGNSYLTNDFDTLPTDRGAYFDEDETFISLPSNDLVSNEISLSNQFSLSFWVLLKDKESVIISTNNAEHVFFYLKINESSGIIEFRIKTLGFDSGQIYSINTQFVYSTWAFLALTCSFPSFQILYNTILSITYTSTLTYAEIGSYSVLLGSDNDYTKSIKGFIWDLYFSLDPNDYLDHISLVSSDYCIIGTCNLPCTPSVVGSDNIIGCLPLEEDPEKNASSENCLCSNIGCYENVCLICSCEYFSCVLEDLSPVCWCPGDTVTSVDMCICPDGKFFDGIDCVACDSECKKCENSIDCIECVSKNAVLKDDGGCKCKDGYYGENLVSQDSCQKCLNLCGKCNSEYLCYECSDQNAYLNNGICFCEDGFYYNETLSSCKKCGGDCKSCSNSETCLECAESNTILTSSGKCSCIDGYYNSTNSLSYILNSPLNCAQCPSDCLTCINSTMCLKCYINSANPNDLGTCQCPENSTLVNNISCSCNSGLYMTKKNNVFYCAECNEECLTCTKYNKCTSCADPRKVVNDEGNCELDCGPGHIAISNICFRCPDLCLYCSSTIECTECAENAYLNDNLCYCNPGCIKSNNICEEYFFNASLKINERNVFLIEFSESAFEPLTKANFSIYFENQTFFPSKFFEKSESQYYFVVDFQKSIQDFTQITLLIHSSPLYSITGAVLLNNTLQGILSPSELELSAYIKAIRKSTTAASQTAVSSSIGIAIVSNPAAAWALINTIQLLAYLPLNKIPISEELNDFFLSLGGYNIIPNSMQYSFSSTDTTSPYTEAQDYGIKTAVFLINIGPTITLFIAILCCWPIAYILSRCNYDKIRKKSLKFMKTYKYGIFIRLWIQSFVEFGIFAAVQLRSVSFI